MAMKTESTYTLAKLLETSTIGQMQNIRRNLQLKGMSSLRKMELVEALAEKIPATVEERMAFLTKSQFELVAEALKKEGIVQINEALLEDVFYYSSLGYIHPLKNEESVAAMPAEIMEAFKAAATDENMKALNRNQRLFDLIVIMLHHYGAVPVETAKAEMEKDIGETLDLKWLKQFIEQLSEHYDLFHLNEKGYIVDELVMDEDELIRKQESRTDLEYAAITQKSSSNVKNLEYIGRTPEMKELAGYLQKQYKFSNEDLEEVLGQTFYMAQLEEPPATIMHLYTALIDFADTEEIQELVDRVKKVVDHTGLWNLKGHTPSSLVPPKETALKVLNAPAAPKQADVNSLASKKKVGRNEPCPCGSGKKYKKCCGR